MKSLNVDDHTKSQAEDFADLEAEIHGFKRGSPQWQRAFQKHMNFALGTMAIGRNPRNFRYKAYTTLYPEIFRESGFAGLAAKNYKGSDGQTGTNLEAVEGRILSSVMNLAKLFENVVMNIRTTTKGTKEGKISNDEMSDLQMPNRESFDSDAEFDAHVKDVLFAWIVRDTICNAIFESLYPFWSLKRADVEEILAKANFDKVPTKQLLKEIREGGREKYIKGLRAAIGDQFHKSYKKAVLG